MATLEFQLAHEREFQGVWWLPGGSGHPVPGTLRYHPQHGVRLTTLGLFSGLRSFFELNRLPLVHGLSRDAGAISLLDAHRRTGSLASHNLDSVEYSARCAVVGAHVPELDQFTPPRVLVWFSSLDEWVQSENLDLDYSEEGLSIRYRVPPTRELANCGGYRISLRAKVEFPTHTVVQTEARVAQRWFLVLEAQQPATLTAYVETIPLLQQFFALSTGARCEPLIVRSDVQIAGEPEKEVDLYYRQFPAPINQEPRRPDQMVFALPDVEEQIASLLTAWVQRAETLGPILDLYFGTVFNPYVYLEQQFLGVVRAFS